MGIFYSCNAYKCMLCPTRKATFNDIKNHYETAHNATNTAGMPDEPNTYKCVICADHWENTMCDIIKHYQTQH